jgi:hypothetical protein
MSILILGSTACPICGEPIVARPDAVQLPYASPAEAGPLAVLGMQYVHRACWATWEARDRYARAATALLDANRVQLGAGATVDAGEQLARHTARGSHGLRFDDLRELVSLEVPDADLTRALGWLGLIVEGQGPLAPLDLPAERWLALVDGSEVTLMRERGGKPVDHVRVPRERVQAWVRFLGGGAR